MAFSFPAGFPRPFGPYLLLSSFGRGGMGEVFLAKRHQLAGVDELCIVKTVRQDLGSDERYARRFLDEARVVVHLSHANICPVFDAGQVGAEYFMTMEYIAGMNLRDLLARVARAGERVPPSVALQIACEVLHALGYAHKRAHPVTSEPLRLVHRDVSPHNVMVGLQGGVKLIDFGLAESTLKEEHTESHVVLGKLAYMAPEQARGVELDARCDQFSACVLLYEMLAGDRYYGDMSQPEIWQVAGTGTFRPRRWQLLEPELQRIVGRGLSAEASRRYASCEELRAELDGYRHARGLVARRDDVQNLLRRFASDRLDWERAMRAACEPLRAPEPGAPLPSGDEVTLILWRDEATGSIAVRDEGGQLARLPLATDAHTDVVPRSQAHPPVPARRRPWAVPLAVSLLVLVALVGAAGAFLTRGTPRPAPEDRVAVMVASPPAAPSVAALAVPTRESDAVEAVPSTTLAQPRVSEADATQVKRPEPRRRKRARRPSQPKDVTPPSIEPATPAPAPSEASAVVAPEPRPAAVEARPARKLTLAESVRVLEGCSNRCADDARSLAKALDDASFTGSKRGVIDFCVRRCLAD